MALSCDAPIGESVVVERTSPQRALVVDDSEVARRALADMLRSAGLEVSVAGSGRDAESVLDARSAGSFDVILMDLHMPDTGGIEACARIKRRRGWEDVPVIVVTASDDDGDLTRAFASGATDYISKPPRDFELLARVRAALRLNQEMARRRAREAELEQLNRRLSEQAEQLSAAQRALREFNEELERRVCAQVDEIVTRAGEIERLNAQLRVQVQERSRELAEALRRVATRRTRKTVTSGKVLNGRVQLLRPLAQGGMGAIYVGRDLVTDTVVAVKLLESDVPADERDLHRFINEAAAAAAIAHPAIVKTTHVDVTPQGDLFLMMELVTGVTLQEILTKGPLSPGTVSALGYAVADALDAAHRVNIIHRDIKPANLMLCRATPGVRVLDFGISKSRGFMDRVTRTQTIGFLGTPAYMAPEQIEDPSAVTAATDVFALGVVLFESATGVRSFRSANSRFVPVGDESPPVTEVASRVPADLAALIDSCLANRPSDRPSAREAANRLSYLSIVLRAPPPHHLLDVATTRTVVG
jgi:serine/threonine-protein kinase